MDELVPHGTDRPLGTAVWADRTFVEERHRFRPGSIWLGRSPTGVPIGYEDDRHVCLVSGTRGGKNATLVINNLCLWPGSVVVLDPKGENASVTAARRGRGSDRCEGMGQAVHVIDPFGVAKVDGTYRARLNPFDALDPRSPLTIDEAGRLADALVIVHPEAKDPFWDDSARNMIRALILHVLTNEQFRGRRTLPTLRQLLLRGDWEKVESLRRQGVNEIASPQALLWMSLTQNRAFGDLLPGLGDSFVDMLQNEPKVFEGVRSVALVNTEFLDSPAIAQSVGTSDFRLSDLKRDARGSSLFLCLPPMYMGSHHRWLRMMITLIVDEMQIIQAAPASGYPLLMVLDEFAGLDRLKSVEKAVAQIAGFGVKLFFVLQSLEQLKAVYKDWETFLANSGLKIFFSVDDHFTRDHVSKLVGETEVVRRARSESESQTSSEGSSEGRSETSGTSSSHGRSTSHGTSESSTHGESYSESRSDSLSSGGSKGQSGRAGWIGGIQDPNYSAGENWSSSHSFGTTKGTSSSRTQGTSRSWSDSHTDGSSHTQGTTSGTTRGTSSGRTSGLSDSVHRRALVAPDEIGRLFARIDDRTIATFPGLALVLTSGQRPIVVRRVNYFDDYEFILRFDAHPMYGAPKLFTEMVDIPTLTRLLADLDGQVSWTRALPDGSLIAAGSVTAVGDHETRTVAPFNKEMLTLLTMHPVVTHSEPFAIQAGVAGRMVARPATTGLPSPLAYTIYTYENERQFDPLAGLAALAARARARRAQAAAESAARRFQHEAEVEIRRVEAAVLDKLDDDLIRCAALALLFGAALVVDLRFEMATGPLWWARALCVFALVGLGVGVGHALWRRTRVAELVAAAVAAKNPDYRPFLEGIALTPTPWGLVVQRGLNRASHKITTWLYR